MNYLSNALQNKLSDAIKFIEVNDSVKSITQIDLSFSNNIYKIVTEKDTLYLRISKPNPLINHKDEKMVLDALKLDYISYDLNTGIYIRKWLDADHEICWNNQSLINISNEINKIHNLKLKIEKFNHKQYWNYFENSEYFSQYSELYLKLLSKYQNDELVVCHCDLNPYNLLSTKNGIKIIDFERVKLNFKYWDFANLMRENMSLENIEKMCEINKLEKMKIFDFLIITCIHALQWTMTIKENHLINSYRENLLSRLSLFITMGDYK
ncbi:MAG: phosphotransferase [Mycoplasma sp.]